MKSLLSTARRVLRNRWVFRSIGIIIFILILLRIDLGEAVRTLANVDLRFVLLSILIQGVALIVSAFRWYIIMRRLEINVPIWRTFMHQLVGTAAALVTPGQLGEFVKVLYHRNEGHPVPESFLSVAIDRAYDLAMLLLFGFISMAILVGLPAATTLILATIGSLLVIIGFLFFRNKEKSADVIARVLRRMSPKAYKEEIHANVRRVALKFGEFDLKILTLSGLLTAVIYVLLLARVYAIVLSLHLDVPLWHFVLTVPLLRLVGLLPISVLGIGTRDLTSIYLFGQVGVPETSALLISTLGLFTLQVQALIGLIAWWRYPLRLSSEDGNLALRPTTGDE